MADVLGQDPIEQGQLDKPSMSQPGTDSQKDIRLQRLKKAYVDVQTRMGDVAPEQFTLPETVSERQFRKRLGSDYNVQGANITDDLAATQSWRENMLLDLPSRALVKGVTEALKIPGAIAGMANTLASIYDPEFSIGQAFNNGYIMALDRMNEKFQNNLAPVYESEAVRDGDIWEKLGSTSFWAKEGADGVGFLLGMMAPGALMRWAGVGDKMAKGFLGLEKLTKPGTAIENMYNATEKAARRYDMISSAIVNTGFEAGIEAQQAYNEYLNEHPDDLIGAAKVGRNTFLANNVILIAPNIIDQQLLFKGWKYGAKGADEGVGGAGVKKLMGQAISKGAKEGEEAIGKIATKGPFGTIGDIGKTLIKGSAKEGLWEEGMQYAASEQAKDSDEAFNPMSVLGEYLDAIQAPTKGNTEMWSGIILGGILGGGMQAIGDVRQAGREEKVANEYAKLLNKNYADFNKTLGELAKVDENGKKIMVKDENGNDTDRYELDLNKVMAAGANVVKYNLLKAKYDRAVKSGNEALADHIQELMRFNYAKSWLKLEGGQELFKQHIKEWATAEHERQVATKGAAAWSVEQLTKDIEDKLPMYQEVIDKTTNTHRLSFDVKGTKATQDQLNDFSNNLLGEKITHKFDIEYAKSKIDEINSQLNKIGLNLTSNDKEVFKHKHKNYFTETEVEESKKKIQSMIDSLESTGLMDKTESQEVEKLMMYKLKMLQMEGTARYQLDQTFDNKYQQKAFDDKMKLLKETEAAVASAEAAKEEAEKAGAEISDPDLKKFHESNIFRAERVLDQSERKTYTGGQLQPEKFLGRKVQVTQRAKAEMRIKDKATGEEKTVQFIVGNPTSKGNLGFVTVRDNEEGNEVIGERGEFKDLKNVTLNKAKYEVVGDIRIIETAQERLNMEELAATQEFLESRIESYNATVAKNEADLQKIRDEIDKNKEELDEAERAYQEALRTAEKKEKDKNVIKLYKKLAKLEKQKKDLKNRRKAALRTLNNHKQRRHAIVKDLRAFKKSPTSVFDEIEKIIQSSSDLEEHASIQISEMDNEIAALDSVIAKYMPLFKGYNTQIAKLLGIKDLNKEAGVLPTDSEVTRLTKASEYLLDKIDSFIYDAGEDYNYQLAEEAATIAQQLTKIRKEVLDSESRIISLSNNKIELNAQREEYRGRKKAYIARWKNIMEIYEKNSVKYFRSKDVVEVNSIEADESNVNMDSLLELASKDENVNTAQSQDDLHPYEDINTFFYLSMNQDEAKDDDNVARWAVFVNNYAALRLKSNPKLPRYKYRVMSFDEVRKLKGPVRDQVTFAIKEKTTDSDGKVKYTVKKFTVDEIEKSKDKTLYEKARQDIKILVVHQEDSSKFLLVDNFGMPIHSKAKARVVFTSLGEATIERDTELGRAGKSLRFDTRKAIESRMKSIAKKYGYEEVTSENREELSKIATEEINKEVEENRQKFEQYREDIIKGRKKGEIIHFRNVTPGKFMGQNAKWTDLVDAMISPMEYWDFYQYRPRKDDIDPETGAFKPRKQNVPYLGMRVVSPGMTYVRESKHSTRIIPVVQRTLGETGDVDNILNIIRYIAAGKPNSKAYLEYLRTVIYFQNHPHEENSKTRMFFEKLTNAEGKIIKDKYMKLHFGDGGVVTADQLRTGQGLADLKAYLAQKYWNFDKLATSEDARKPFVEMRVDNNLNALPTKTWKTTDGGYVGFLFSNKDGNKSKGQIKVRPLPKGKNQNFLLAKDPQFKNKAIKTSLSYDVAEEYSEESQEAKAVSKDAAFLADVRKELGHDDIILYSTEITGTDGEIQEYYFLYNKKAKTVTNDPVLLSKHKYKVADLSTNPEALEAAKATKEQLNSDKWDGSFKAFKVLGDTYSVTAKVVPLDRTVTVTPSVVGKKVITTGEEVKKRIKKEVAPKVKENIEKIKSAKTLQDKAFLIGAIMEKLTGDGDIEVSEPGSDGWIWIKSGDNWTVNAQLNADQLNNANESAIVDAIKSMIDKLAFDDEVVEETAPKGKPEAKGKMDTGIGGKKVHKEEEEEEDENLHDEEYRASMEKAFSVLEKDDPGQAANYFKRAERSWMDQLPEPEEEDPFGAIAKEALNELSKTGKYDATIRPVAIDLFIEDLEADSAVEVKPLFKKDSEIKEPPFRLADKEEGDYTLEELNELKTWWSNKFPKIPLKEVTGLIEGKAWGALLKSARVLISTSAAEGTGYHEAFHVWDLLFNDEVTRKKLYTEVRKRTGRDMSDKEAEEFLADEFMDFMMLKDKYKFNKGEEIKKTFFQKILAYIKELIYRLTGKKFGEDRTDIILKAFKTIDEGKFYTPINTLSESWMRVAGVSARMQQAMLDDMDVRFFNLVMGDLAKDGDLILRFELETDEIYNELRAVYARDNAKDTGMGKAPKYGVLLSKWDEFVKQHKQRLLQYQITMPGVNVPLDTHSEDDQTRNISDWSEPFEQSMKDRTATPIRLLVASLPSVKSYNKKTGSWLRNIVSPFRTLVNVQYDKMMNILYGQLTGSVNPQHMLSKIKDLTGQYPELNLLYDALSHDSATSKSLLSMAFASFATNKNTVILQILDNNGYTINKDLVSQTDTEVVRNAWITEGQALAKNNKTKLIKWNGYDYVMDLTELSHLLDAREYGDIALKILEGLGMTYGMGGDNISKRFFSQTQEVSSFLNELDGIVSGMIKSGKKTESLNSLYDRNVFKLQGELNRIASIASLSTTNDVDLMYFNQDGNLEWAITKNNHASNVKNRLIEHSRRVSESKKEDGKSSAPFSKELEHLRPFDGVSGNLYTMGSELLELANEGTLELAYYLIKGADTSYRDGADLSELTNPQYLATSFEMVLNNIIPFKRAADRGPEQAFKWKDTNWGVTAENFIADSKKYLIDEIATSFAIRTGKKQYGAGIANYEKHARELRTFSFIHDDFFQKNEIPSFDEYLTGKKLTALMKSSPTTIVKMANDYYNEYKVAIESATENFLNFQKETTYNTLIDNKIIIKTMRGGIPAFQAPGLNLQSVGIQPDKFNELTQDEIDTLLLVHSYNYFMGMQEQYKVFFGDPASYKSFTDLDKRTTSSMSTITLTANDEALLSYLNSDANQYKKVNGMPYSENINAVAITKIKNDKQDPFLNSISEEYGKADIVDGAMFGTLDFLRDLSLRTSKWSDDKEATYQFQMQSFVIEVINTPELQAIWPEASKEMFRGNGVFARHTGGKYTGVPYFNGKEIGKMSSLMAKLPSAKTLGVGNIAGDNNMFVRPIFVNKMAVSVILPTEISFSAKKLLASMIANNIDKFGDETTMKSSAYINAIDPRKGDLFDKNTALTQMSFSDYGYQSEVNEEEKGKVTDSQQKACVQYTDVYDKGRLVNDSLNKHYTAYHNSINELTMDNFNKTIDELAVAKDLEGNYYLPKENVSKFRDLMMDMFNQRLLPDNILDGLDEVIDSEQKVFDLFTDHKKASAVLTAVIKNRVIKRKVKGEMLVQEPDFLYTLGEERLKFYRQKVDKDGNPVEGADLLRAECMISLPEEFVPMVDKLGGLDRLNYLLKKGKLPVEMYEIVANRIPTTKINTVEALTVVKFLPPHAGARIILPAEIVVKTSSDYDIDKLTTYFNHFEMVGNKLKLDGDGMPIPVDPNGDTDAAIQNRMNGLTAVAVLNSERQSFFLGPVSASRIADLADHFYVPATSTEKLEKQVSGKGYSTVLWSYNGKKALDFWEGIRGVAYGAAQNTVHPFLQFAPIRISDPAVRFFFEGQELKDGQQYTSGHIHDYNNFDIATTYEQFLVAFVDVAKDPFVINLLGTLDTYSIFSFLNRFGIDSSIGARQIAALISNPMVRKYIKEMQITKSLFAKHNPYVGHKEWSEEKERYVDKWAEQNMGFKSDVFERLIKGTSNLKNSPMQYIDTVTYSLGKYLNSTGEQKAKHLKDILDKYNKYKYRYLTEDQLKSNSKLVAIQALDNFMMYELLAKHNLSLNSLLRPYSANGFPKSVEGLMSKQANKERTLEKSIFDARDVINTINSTFIRSHEHVYNESINVLGWTSLIYKYPAIRVYFMEMLKRIPVTTSREKVEKIVEAYKSNLLAYVWVLSMTDSNSSMRDFYKEYFTGETSLPLQLATLKESGKISGEIFDYLRPVINEWNSDLISARENSYINTFNKNYGLSMDNILVGSFQDLFKNGDAEVQEFLGKLIHFSLLQSGLRNSQYSFMKLIPNTIFIPEFDRRMSIVADKNEGFNGDDFMMKLDSFTDQFFRNNAADPDIVYRSGVTINGLSKLIDAKVNPEADFELQVRKLSFKRNETEAGHTYISVRYSPLTSEERAKYIKAKRKIPYEILLYKRDSIDPTVNNPKAPRTFSLVGKLGDGLRMAEYYPEYTTSSPRSVLKSNSYEHLREAAKESPASIEKTKGGATIKFQTSRLEGYSDRTRRNASADATIAFAINFDSAGEKLTKKSVQEQGKEYIPIDISDLDIDQKLIDLIVSKLNKANKGKKNIVVNIAGNSLYTLKNKYTQAQLDQFIYDILDGIMKSPKFKKKIVLVRSGGQTGMDEAGVKGAAMHNIETLVYAPKGWVIRDGETGKDVSLSETEFKARFLDVSQRNQGSVTTETNKAITKSKTKFRKQYQASYGTEYTAPIPELDAAMEDFFTAHGFTKNVVDRIVDHTGTVVPAIAATDIFNKTIEVVDGTANLNQLPEEAAHLYIGMLDKNDPLYKSMYANIVNYPIYRKVVDTHDKLYKTDEVSTKETKLREEAIGQLIAERIIEGYNAGITERQVRQVETWWSSLWRKIKEIVAFTRKDEYAKAAYDILNSSVKNLVNQEVSPYTSKQYQAQAKKQFELELLSDLKTSLQNLSESSADPFHRMAASALLDLPANVNTASIFVSKVTEKISPDVYNDMLGESAIGRYVPEIGAAGGMFILDMGNRPHEKKAMTEALLHEAMHAASVNAYSSDKEFKKKIDKIYSLAKKFWETNVIGENIPYGLTNQLEFMSELFINPEFQGQMAEIPIPRSYVNDSINEGNLNVFAAFVAMILDFFANKGYIENSEEYVSVLEAGLQSMVQHAKFVEYNEGKYDKFITPILKGEDINSVVSQASAEQQWKELPLVTKGIYKYDYFRTIDHAETAFEIYKQRFGVENVTLHSITDSKYKMKIAIKKPTYAGDPAQKAIDQQNVAMSNVREMSKAPQGYSSEDSLRDFDTYFPDLSWLEDSEKEMLMKSIENGDNQIVCEF